MLRIKRRMHLKGKGAAGIFDCGALRQSLTKKWSSLVVLSMPVYSGRRKVFRLGNFTSELGKGVHHNHQLLTGYFVILYCVFPFALLL